MTINSKYKWAIKRIFQNGSKKLKSNYIQFTKVTPITKHHQVFGQDMSGITKLISVLVLIFRESLIQLSSHFSKFWLG